MTTRVSAHNPTRAAVAARSAGKSRALGGADEQPEWLQLLSVLGAATT